MLSAHIRANNPNFRTAWLARSALAFPRAGSIPARFRWSSRIASAGYSFGTQVIAARFCRSSGLVKREFGYGVGLMDGNPVGRLGIGASQNEQQLGLLRLLGQRYVRIGGFFDLTQSRANVGPAAKRIEIGRIELQRRVEIGQRQSQGIEAQIRPAAMIVGGLVRRASDWWNSGVDRRLIFVQFRVNESVRSTLRVAGRGPDTGRAPRPPPRICQA